MAKKDEPQKEGDAEVNPAKAVEVPLPTDEGNFTKLGRLVSSGGKAVYKRVDTVITDQILGVIVLGMLGLLLGAGLFVYGNRPYGEIYLSNKVELVDTILSLRSGRLKNNITSFRSSLTSLLRTQLVGKTGRKDTALMSTLLIKQVYTDSLKQLQRKIDLASMLLRKTMTEKDNLDYGNSDTSIAYFSKYLLVGRHDFLDSLTVQEWRLNKDTLVEKRIFVTLADTCKSLIDTPLIIRGELVLTKHKHESNISFFSDYPQFGLWIIFSMAQVVLWTMIVPLIVAKITRLNTLLSDRPDSQKPIGRLRVLGNTWVPILLLLTFVLVFYYWMIDRRVITDNYFLRFYTRRTFVFSLIGYGVASFCFGIFITLSNTLDDLNRAAPSFVEMNNMVQGDQNQMSEKSSLYLRRYQALKSAFDNSFFCSALILSFSVLWLGILVSALNGTEAFRFYFYLSGNNVLPNDFVYLLGLMNTVILLIFYIPVRLKFSSLSISKLPEASASGGVGGSSNSNSIFKGLSDTLGPLIVTSSPLLASLVHTIFSVFVKN